MPKLHVEDARAFLRSPRCSFVPFPMSAQTKGDLRAHTPHLGEPQPVLPAHPRTKTASPWVRSKGQAPSSLPQAFRHHHQVPSPWHHTVEFFLKTPAKMAETSATALRTGTLPKWSLKSEKDAG